MVLKGMFQCEPRISVTPPLTARDYSRLRPEAGSQKIWLLISNQYTNVCRLLIAEPCAPNRLWSDSCFSLSPHSLGTWILQFISIGFFTFILFTYSFYFYSFTLLYPNPSTWRTWLKQHYKFFARLAPTVAYHCLLSLTYLLTFTLEEMAIYS